MNIRNGSKIEFRITGVPHTGVEQALMIQMMKEMVTKNNK